MYACNSFTNTDTTHFFSFFFIYIVIGCSDFIPKWTWFGKFCVFLKAYGTVKPTNWSQPVYELSTDQTNNGFQNEDFIVWMRTAALPTFRKLYRRIDSGKFSAGLPPGTYKLEIQYSILFTETERKCACIFITLFRFKAVQLFLCFG